jgi:hypothetical protein
MLAHLRVPIGWGEIFKRTAKEGYVDDILDQIKKISESEDGGILTFAFVYTLWSSSGAMMSIITTLNTAYDIQDSRPWWKTRLLAIALTIGLALFILISFALVIAGPTVAGQLATRLYLGPAFVWTWKIVQWPVVFALVVTGMALIYYHAPDAEQEFVWITPGGRRSPPCCGSRSRWDSSSTWPCANTRRASAPANRRRRVRGHGRPRRFWPPGPIGSLAPSSAFSHRHADRIPERVTLSSGQACRVREKGLKWPCFRGYASCSGRTVLGKRQLSGTARRA